MARDQHPTDSDRGRKRPRLSLDGLEQRLGNVIERPFSRLFRSPVQPAEIERACTREVEKTRKLGVGTAYVANVYYIVISPQDEEALGDLIETLEQDLSTRLYAYAANQRYDMVTRPIVQFMVDDEFKTGDLLVYGEHMSEEAVEEEFGISLAPSPSRPSFNPEVDRRAPLTPAPVAIRTPAPVFADEVAPSPERYPAASAYAPEAGLATAPVGPREQLGASVTIAGRPALTLRRGMRYTIGRQEGCDISIASSQVSRVHAVIEPEGDGWAIEDRDSTNGTLVNRQPVSRQRLRDGDTIRVGDTDIAYRERFEPAPSAWSE